MTPMIVSHLGHRADLLSIQSTSSSLRGAPQEGHFEGSIYESIESSLLSSSISYSFAVTMASFSIARLFLHCRLDDDIQNTRNSNPIESPTVNGAATMHKHVITANALSLLSNDDNSLHL
jgi:hypothetical protein